MTEQLSLHQRIKKAVHGFRIPLSRRGRRVAGVVYFTLPIVGGCMLMERVMQYSEDHKADWMTPEHEARVRALQAEALANASKQSHISHTHSNHDKNNA